MKLLSCLLLVVADGLHLPACGDGSAEETALISTFSACRNDPVYLRTGSTGCCGANNHSLGECDVCTGKFSCSGTADVASVGWGVIVALVADILISVGLETSALCWTCCEIISLLSYFMCLCTAGDNHRLG